MCLSRPRSFLLVSSVTWAWQSGSEQREEITSGVVVSLVPFKVTCLVNRNHPAQIWLISLTDTCAAVLWTISSVFSRALFLWDGGGLRWIIPAVPSTEITLSETGSSLAPTYRDSAETETSWGWWVKFHCFETHFFFAALYIWNLLPADPSVEIPEHLQEKPGPSSRILTAAGSLPNSMETFSDLLVMDMSKLAVHGGYQSNENQESAQHVPPLRSLEPFRWPGGSGDSRPALPAGVGIIPDPNFNLFSKYCHCPHGPVPSVQPAGAADKHGRRLLESDRRDADVRCGAAVSHLRFLPRGFPRRHQHQRRLSTPPLHPHHLKYTRCRGAERAHGTLWHRLRQDSLEQCPTVCSCFLFLFFYSWCWRQQHFPSLVYLCTNALSFCVCRPDSIGKIKTPALFTSSMVQNKNITSVIVHLVSASFCGTQLPKSKLSQGFYSYVGGPCYYGRLVLLFPVLCVI